MLGCRAFALESAAARVCREAGARVTTNVMVRGLKSVWMVVVWKLSQTGFHHSMEPNLPWTRQWSRH